MKLRSFLTGLLLDICLIFLGVYGSVCCLLSAFSLPELPELWFIVAFLTVTHCLLLRNKKVNRIAVPCILLLLVGFTLLIRSELGESFRNLWGELGYYYARGYDAVQDYLPREATTPAEARMAILYLAIIQTVLCSIFVRAWKRTLPVALLLLFGIAPCFILLDTEPELLPLLLAVLSLMTQAFSQSTRRRSQTEGGKAVMLSAVTSAAILWLLLTLFPQEGYTPPLSWENLTNSMSHWASQQNNRGNVRAGLNGNLDQVELRELGALPNHPLTMLYAKTAQGGDYYLRGLSYAVFDGENWRHGEQRVWDQEVLFPGAGCAGHSSISIQTVNAESVIFTTYYPAGIPEDAVLAGDAFVRNPNGKQTYTSSFAPEDFDEEIQALFAQAAHSESYAAWVEQSYLGLPEQTRAGVLAWWEAHKEAAFSDAAASMEVQLPSPEELLQYDPVQYAEIVANCISKCARYSRNPDRVPANEDFCTWFLNEAETGYCVHYATACTALLRALGIPARYVTGYVCALRSQQSTAVTNLNAHAWVEIWSRGRWRQIEPTPADATEFTGRTMPIPTVATTQSLSESTERQVQDVQDSLFPEESVVRPTKRPRSKQEASASTSDPGASTPSAPEESAPTDLTPLWFALGIAVLLALLAGRRALKQSLWRKRLRRAADNERAKMIFRRIERMNRLSGISVSKEALQIAKKASFSQHCVKPEELAVLQKDFEYAEHCLSRSGIWKMLYAKYLLCIL